MGIELKDGSVWAKKGRYHGTILFYEAEYPNDGFLTLEQQHVEELIEQLAESIGHIANLRPIRTTEHGREEPLTEAELAATPYADLLTAVSSGRVEGRYEQ